MPDVVGIANGHVALQLRLAGVPVEEASDPSEAESILSELLETRTHMVIVQENLGDGFSSAFKERLARHRSRPLVVPCPTFDAEELDVDDYLAAMLRPAIGYEIRLD